MSDTEEPTEQQQTLKSAANSYARQRGHFTTAVKNSRAALDVSEEHAKKPVFYEAIVKSLEKIEVQYQKVLAALDKYVSLEPPQDKANEAEARFVEVTDIYNELLLKLKTAIAAHQGDVSEDGSSNTGGNGNDNVAEHQGGGPGAKITLSFKPKPLSHDDSYTTFTYWKEKFETYYSLARLNTIEVKNQKTALYECLDKDLEQKLRMASEPNLPILGENSAMTALDEIFRTMNPLHARRQAFFDAEQDKGQSMSSFMAKLDALSNSAELDKLDTEQLMVYRLIAGCKNAELRQKILEKEEEPTMKSLVAVINAYEAAKNSAPSKGFAAYSVQRPNFKAKRRRGRGRPKGKQRPRGRSSSRSANAAQIVCYRCGKSSHTRDKCSVDGETLTCEKCNKKGHVKSVCGYGRRRSQSGRRGRSMSQRRRSPSPYKRGKHQRSRSSYQESNAAHAASTPSMPTPRVTLRLTGPGKGTVAKIHFTTSNAMPDSGATCTIISKSLIDANNIRYKRGRDADITVADGGSIPVIGTVELEAKYLDKHMAKFKALICDNLASADILLGWQQCVQLSILSPQFPLPIDQASAHSAEASSDPECILLERKMLQEFPDVLCDELQGKTIKNATMTINVKKDDKTPPLRVCTPRAVPIHHKEEAQKVIDNLIKEGIIERVPPNEPAEWCSPAFFVPKPNSTAVRLVTDYRVLNSLVVRAPKPFASTKEIIRNLSPNSKCFAKLDAVNGYYQIPLAKDSRPYTTFMLESGRYRYCRGPMGLSATGDAFCEATDRAFENQRGTQKIVDDGITCAESLSQLETRLRALLLKCREYNITLSKKKFAVGRSVKFAGHIISTKGVQPDPEKVEALQSFPRPTNVTEARSFLGLANQLGYFVPDLTHLCRPIHELTKKDLAFVWGPAQENAFEQTKEILTSDLLVQPFDPELQTELYTDASRQGLGYLLAQRDHRGHFRLIRCGSRALTGAESRYAVTELECLAVYYAVKHCEFYLTGAPEITVITDHRALIGLWQKSLAEVPNARVLRYRERLAQFNLKLVWKAGKTHAMADALSRDPRFGSPATDPEAFLTNDLEEANEDVYMAMLVLASMAEVDPNMEHLLEKRDDEYMKLIDAVEDTKLPESLNEYRRSFPNMCIIGSGDNKLLVLNNTKMVIPRPARAQLMQHVHAAHGGYRKTHALASKFLYWPNMANDIHNMCDTCDACRDLAPARQREPPNLAKLRPVSDMFPMSDVAADLFDALGYTYLVMVDRFSGFPFCTKLASTTTKSITDKLKAWWTSEGIPCRIRTDGGPQFRTPFKEFCDEMGVEHELSSAYNPESNGLAEAAVKTCKNLLIKCKMNNEDFNLALLAWRATPPGPGKPSPAQLFRHRDLKIAGLPRQECTLQYLSSETMEEFIEERQQQFDAQRDQVQQRARKVESEPLEIGSLVDFYDPKSKSWQKNVGLIIHHRPDSNSYVVKDQNTDKSYTRNRKFLRKSLPVKITTHVDSSDSEVEIMKDLPKRKISEKDNSEKEKKSALSKRKLDEKASAPKRVRIMEEEREHEPNVRAAEKALRRSVRMLNFISTDSAEAQFTSQLKELPVLSQEDLDAFLVCQIDIVPKTKTKPKVAKKKTQKKVTWRAVPLSTIATSRSSSPSSSATRATSPRRPSARWSTSSPPGSRSCRTWTNTASNSVSQCSTQPTTKMMMTLTSPKNLYPVSPSLLRDRLELLAQLETLAITNRARATHQEQEKQNLMHLEKKKTSLPTFQTKKKKQPITKFTKPAPKPLPPKPAKPKPPKAPRPPRVPRPQPRRPRGRGRSPSPGPPRGCRCATPRTWTPPPRTTSGGPWGQTSHQTKKTQMKNKKSSISSRACSLSARGAAAASMVPCCLRGSSIPQYATGASSKRLNNTRTRTSSSLSIPISRRITSQHATSGAWPTPTITTTSGRTATAASSRSTSTPTTRSPASPSSGPTSSTKWTVVTRKSSRSTASAASPAPRASQCPRSGCGPPSRPSSSQSTHSRGTEGKPTKTGKSSWTSGGKKTHQQWTPTRRPTTRTTTSQPRTPSCPPSRWTSGGRSSQTPKDSSTSCQTSRSAIGCHATASSTKRLRDTPPAPRSTSATTGPCHTRSSNSCLPAHAAWPSLHQPPPSPPARTRSGPLAKSSLTHHTSTRKPSLDATRASSPRASATPARPSCRRSASPSSSGTGRPPKPAASHSRSTLSPQPSRTQNTRPTWMTSDGRSLPSSSLPCSDNSWSRRSGRTSSLNPLAAPFIPRHQHHQHLPAAASAQPLASPSLAALWPSSDWCWQGSGPTTAATPTETAPCTSCGTLLFTHPPAIWSPACRTTGQATWPGLRPTPSCRPPRAPSPSTSPAARRLPPPGWTPEPLPQSSATSETELEAEAKAIEDIYKFLMS